MRRDNIILFMNNIQEKLLLILFDMREVSGITDFPHALSCSGGKIVQYESPAMPFSPGGVLCPSPEGTIVQKCLACGERIILK